MAPARSQWPKRASQSALTSGWSVPVYPAAVMPLVSSRYVSSTAGALPLARCGDS